MSGEVIIRKYQEDDYEDVRRIFISTRIVELAKNGILLGLKSPKVIGFLTAMFAVGSLHSTFFGILLLSFGLAAHSLMIYLYFALYTRWVFISTFEMTRKSTPQHCYLVS